MSGFAPAIVNPYPETYDKISHVTYIEPLQLVRLAKTPSELKESDREGHYIVSQTYRLEFRLDGARRVIVVPRGMLTDLSSVPVGFRNTVGRVGPHLEASIVHDFLYIAWQDLDLLPSLHYRRFADALMLEAMKAAGVGLFKRQIVHKALWLGGGFAFKGRNEHRYVDLDQFGIAKQP